MRIVEGIVPADLTIEEPCTVAGIVNGDIRVLPRGVLTLRGVCNGRVLVSAGGQAEVLGIVNGGVHHAPAAD